MSNWDVDDTIKKMKEWNKSPEGIAYFKNIKDRNNIQNRQIEKFKSLYEDKLDYVIETLQNKYQSDKYRDKEYKLGFEPREKLLWFVFEYAIKYCKPCNNKKYWNMFTGEAYYIGSYVIQIMHGQGSVLRIDKKK